MILEQDSWICHLSTSYCHVLVALRGAQSFKSSVNLVCKHSSCSGSTYLSSRKNYLYHGYTDSLLVTRRSEMSAPLEVAFPVDRMVGFQWEPCRSSSCLTEGMSLRIWCGLKASACVMWLETDTTFGQT